MRWTSTWLFHRNCPSPAASSNMSSSSSSTPTCHLTFFPGGNPFRERCHFCPMTFQGIMSSGLAAAFSLMLFKARDRFLQEAFKTPDA